VKFVPSSSLDLPPEPKPGKTEGDEHVSSPADHTTRASHSTSVFLGQTPSYLSRPEGRIGYDVAGGGSPVVLVPGLGDLRAGRGLQPAENVIPLVRRDVVACHGPRLLAVPSTVSACLSAGSLRALDTRVELRGQDPRPVAGNWPRTQGLAWTGEMSR
jgi:hypothetical protein